MRSIVAFALSSVLVLTAAVPGAAFGSPAAPRAPVANEDVLAALGAAMEGAPVGEPVTVPALAEARARAEAIVFERATPERLAATLDALAAGEPVEHLDRLVAGVVLYHAAPQRADSPLAARALAALTAATDLRVALAPSIEGVAPAVDPGVTATTTPATRFGDASVLATSDRTLRVDTLRLTHTEVIDWSEAMTVIRSSYVSREFANEFSYYYSNAWFSYYYYYSLYERNTASHSSYDSVLRTLFTYLYQFDQWTQTSGVSVALVEQSAPAGPATARMLYELVTPYSYVDHWWLAITIDDVFYQLTHSEQHSFTQYWSEVTSQYAIAGSSSQSFSNSYTVGYRFRSASERRGFERIPVEDVRLLAAPSIRFDFPLGEYLPLPRETHLVDVASAAAVSLPGQVGVEYKDAKSSDALVTTPDFTDLSVIVATDPLTNAGLTRLDETVALVPGPDAVLAPVLAEAGALTAFPGGYVAGKIAMARETATGLASNPPGIPCDPVVDPVACDPNLPEAPTVPATEAWWQAAYLADFTTSWKSGGAGVGFVSVDGMHPAGRAILVTFDGAGLGRPITFAVDRDGADLEATELLPETPEPPALPPEIPPLPTFQGPEAADLIPYEASFPAFLDSIGVASGAVSTLDAAQELVLASATPGKLARTMRALGEATTPENAVSFGDASELGVLAHYAGAGYAEDPAFGDEARARLGEAVALLATPGNDADPGCAPTLPEPPALPALPVASPPLVGPPTLPPEVTSIAGCVQQAAVEAANSVAAVPLDDISGLAFDGALLQQDTIVNDGFVYRDHSSYYGYSDTRTSTYVGYYESAYIIDTWYRYASTYYSATAAGNGGWYVQESYDRILEYREWYTRVDFLSGVTSVALAASGESGEARGTVVLAAALPYTLSSVWALDALYRGYVDAYLVQYGSWASYYRYAVTNGVPSVSSSSSYNPTSYGYTWVSTGWTVNGASEVVAIPNVAIAEGARLSYFVPATDHALLARTAAPFLTGGLGGIVPFQDATDRTDAFFADSLVIGPVPNAVRVVVDDDPTVEKPLAVVGGVEGRALAMQGDVENLYDALRHDAPGIAQAAADEAAAAAQGITAPILADPAAFAQNAAGSAAAPLLALAGALQSDPQGFLAGAAGNALRAAEDAQVALPVIAIPRELGSKAYYEVSFTSAALASLAPVITVVGVLSVPDSTAVDARDVLVSITAQGIAGSGALGGSEPFQLTHALDVNGGHALPGTVGGDVVRPIDLVPEAPAPPALPDVPEVP